MRRDVTPGNPSATGTSLDARYGRTRAFRRRERIIAWSIAIAIALTFVLWVVFAAFNHDSATIDAKNIGYRVTAENEVEVTFDVSRPPGSGVSCSVQALNESFGIIGWRVFDVPASSNQTDRYTLPVRTIEPAVTGTVHTCYTPRG